MSNEADAVLECFGVSQFERELDELFAPFRCELVEHGDDARVAFENLAYGGERLFCAALRELAISYVFFHAGDHEHAPWTRLFAPGLGEWAGSADAEGNVLVPANAIDREIERLEGETDDVVLIEELDAISGALLRDYFETRRAAMLSGSPDSPQGSL